MLNMAISRIYIKAIDVEKNQNPETFLTTLVACYPKPSCKMILLTILPIPAWEHLPLCLYICTRIRKYLNETEYRVKRL